MRTVAYMVTKRFTKVDTNVIHDTRLSSNALKMYLVMHSLKHMQYAGNAYFIKVLGVSQGTVTKVRKELIEAGYLEVQRLNKLEYRAFLGTSQVSGLEVKKRFYKDELHTKKD